MRRDRGPDQRYLRISVSVLTARARAFHPGALVLVVVAVVAALTAPAAAHQTSVKYVDLTVTSDKTLAVTVKLAPSDVTEPMGLANDAKPPVADALAHPGVPAYVQGWFAIAGCTAGTPTAGPANDAAFVAVSYTATCETPRELALDFTPFFQLDARHEAIIRITAPGATAVSTIVRAGEPRVTLRAGEAPSLLAWVKTGMDHIYEGIDHILFVIALLLVVMLQRGVGPGEWHTRGFVLTLKSTAVVITAFTVAHSITLIAAALGMVALPSSFVEAVIAASIAYTAVEDVVKPDVRWRFVLTFAFGLVHGVGFAGTLAGLLPPTDVVVPLLCFNLGVEIGQLSIVLVVLPLLWLAARKIGAARYRRHVLPLLAAPIFLVGLAMVVDRVM